MKFSGGKLGTGSSTEGRQVVLSHTGRWLAVTSAVQKKIDALFGGNGKTKSALRVECQPLREVSLDATRQRRTFSGMANGKKKLFGAREMSKKEPSLGLVITLAAAGGMVIGSAGTYFFSKPPAAPKQSASPAPPAQSVAVPSLSPPRQFTPAPQPPGEVPPGKVWSVEHGHWHDAPVALTVPTSPTATVTPAVVTPPAPAAPAEKKE